MITERERQARAMDLRNGMSWLGQVSTEHHNAGTLTEEQDATVCELMAWGHGAHALLNGGGIVPEMALTMWHGEVEAVLWSMGVKA